MHYKHGFCRKVRDIHRCPLFKQKALALHRERGTEGTRTGFRLQKGVMLLGQTISLSPLSYEFSITGPSSGRGRTEKRKQVGRDHRVDFRLEQNWL